MAGNEQQDKEKLNNVRFYHLVLLLAASALFWLVLKKKNMEMWFLPYLKNRLNNPKTDKPIHVLFCFVDHFEPQWKNRDNIELERERVDRWFKDYPLMAEQHKDADGVMPNIRFSIRKKSIGMSI